MMFTKLKNRMAGNTFALTCIAFIIVAIIMGFFFFGCGHIQSPIRVNMEPAKAFSKATASSVGYLVGKQYPVESGVALLVADIMIENERPLQDVVNNMVGHLSGAIEDDYLRLQCEQLLEDLNIEINVDGLILVEQGNELVQEALHSFLAGLRASQGVIQ